MSEFVNSIIEVKTLVAEVNELLNSQKKSLNELSESISKYGKASKLPSDFLNAQKESIKLDKERTDLQKKIEENAKKQTAATQKLNKEQLSYVQSVEKGIKSKEKEALALKKLNDAYGQLTTKRNEAARALQNEILRTGEFSKETAKLRKEFDALNQKLGQADKAIGKFSQANSGIKAITGSIGGLMSAFGISTGVFLAVDIAKNIYQTTKELQSLDLALKQVSDTGLKYAANVDFIKEVSERWGLEIKGTTEQFTKFYADAKGKLSEVQIKETFEGVAKAGSVMGLSLEKQKSAFTAFQQMLSKGTIQAQELKLQLGDALPGSIKVATQAYQQLHPELKVTEALLYKHMEQGKLISSEMIPLMVKGYQKLYGIENVTNINTFAAAQNRLSNSWTELIRGITGGESIFSKFVGGFMNGMAWFITNSGKIIDALTGIGSLMQGIYDLVNKEEAKQRISNEKKKTQIEKAKSDIEKLTSSEKKLTLELKTKNDELNRYYTIQKTATGKELEDIKKKIQAKKEEIKVSENKLNVEERSNKAKGTGKYNNSLSIANKLEAESNKLNLESINSLEKINKLKGSSSGSALEARQKAAEIARLEKTIEANKAQIRANNEEFAYHKKVVQSLESKTEGDGIAKSPTAPLSDKEKKAIKIQKEKETKDEEAHLRDLHDLKIAQYERDKELKEKELEETKLGFSYRLQLASEIAVYEMAIAKENYDEQLRLAKGNDEKTKIVDINYLKEKEKLIEQHLKRVQGLTSPTSYKREKFVQDEEKYGTGVVEFDFEKNKELVEEFKSGIKEAKDLEKSQIKAFNTFVGDFAERSGFGESFDLFGKLDKDGKTMFSNLLTDAKKTGDEMNVVFQGIATAAQDALNLIAESSMQRYANERVELEKQRDTAIEFAGDSDAAKKKIDEDYEKRRKGIALREFKAKQKITMVNIAIDTAQAIMAVVGKTGAVWMIPVIAALGAVQLGIVASQKPPEFWMGTDNAPEGLAWTQERGQEIITDKKGVIKDMGDNKGARLTKLNAGDKVFNAEKTRRILFEQQYSDILASNGILDAKVEINSGVSASEMRQIMNETLGSRPTLSLSMDRQGFNQSVIKSGSTTKRAENRGEAIGLEF